MRKLVDYIWEASLKWILQMVKISKQLEQKQQLSPQQVLQASLLQLSLPLLEQRILHELEINPALEMNALPNEIEEIQEEKPDSEEEIEFDWEELLGEHDDFEYPKIREKQDEKREIPLVSQETFSEKFQCSRDAFLYFIRYFSISYFKLC